MSFKLDKTEFRKQAVKLVAQMTLDEKCGQMLFTAPAIPRLGIPAYNWWNEALHGVARCGTATVFPQAIGMAASFNDELLHEVAVAISDEARANYNEYKKFGETEQYQGLTFWSPNINIFRDPRWGRGHETYGEDPYLTGRMGTAFIRGLQGEGKYRKVDATIKHFAVHSGPEKLRHEFNVDISREEMDETYLYAFKYCIDHADPSAVMGAYNRVNGEPCCGSAQLLQDILRGEWGFDGYVVSDCGAICDFDQHHKVTKNGIESAALAVNRGCDLNCGSAYSWLKAAVTEGLLSEEVLTESVVRLFTARYALGMFADDCEYDRIPYDTVCSEANRKLNLRMAEESIVLLKNDGILPLKNGKDLKIAVVGPNADDKLVLLANYAGTMDRYVTLLAGIQEACEGRVYYNKACNITNPNPNRDAGEGLRSAIVAARQADVVILCMGLNSVIEGEEGDGGDRHSLDLPESQWDLYQTILETGKPMIYVNVSGSAVNLNDMKKHCNAVVQCFYPGAEGGRALANILFGKTSPSGRLPVTFYRSVEDLPPFEDYSMKGRTYKYFKGEPVYPFGYGLTYADISETWTDEKTVTVRHKGGMATDYSVLCFAKTGTPRLLDFKKIHLEPGEEKTVRFADRP